MLIRASGATVDEKKIGLGGSKTFLLDVPCSYKYWLPGSRPS